jgi:hypothetical protein
VIYYFLVTVYIYLLSLSYNIHQSSMPNYAFIKKKVSQMHNLKEETWNEDERTWLFGPTTGTWPV